MDGQPLLANTAMTARIQQTAQKLSLDDVQTNNLLDELLPIIEATQQGGLRLTQTALSQLDKPDANAETWTALNGSLFNLDDTSPVNDDLPIANIEIGPLTDQQIRWFYPIALFMFPLVPVSGAVYLLSGLFDTNNELVGKDYQAMLLAAGAGFFTTSLAPILHRHPNRRNQYASVATSILTLQIVEDINKKVHDCTTRTAHIALIGTIIMSISAELYGIEENNSNARMAASFFFTLAMSTTLCGWYAQRTAANLDPRTITANNRLTESKATEDSCVKNLRTSDFAFALLNSLEGVGPLTVVNIACHPPLELTISCLGVGAVLGLCIAMNKLDFTLTNVASFNEAYEALQEQHNQHKDFLIQHVVTTGIESESAKPLVEHLLKTKHPCWRRVAWEFRAWSSLISKLSMSMAATTTLLSTSDPRVALLLGIIPGSIESFNEAGMTLSIAQHNSALNSFKDDKRLSPTLTTEAPSACNLMLHPSVLAIITLIMPWFWVGTRGLAIIKLNEHLEVNSPEFDGFLYALAASSAPIMGRMFSAFNVREFWAHHDAVVSNKAIAAAIADNADHATPEENTPSKSFALTTIKALPAYIAIYIIAFYTFINDTIGPLFNLEADELPSTTNVILFVGVLLSAVAAGYAEWSVANEDIRQSYRDHQAANDEDADESIQIHEATWAQAPGRRRQHSVESFQAAALAAQQPGRRQTVAGEGQHLIDGRAPGWGTNRDTV